MNVRGVAAGRGGGGSAAAGARGPAGAPSSASFPAVRAAGAAAAAAAAAAASAEEPAQEPCNYERFTIGGAGVSVYERECIGGIPIPVDVPPGDAAPLSRRNWGGSKHFREVEQRAAMVPSVAGVLKHGDLLVQHQGRSLTWRACSAALGDDGVLRWWSDRKWLFGPAQLKGSTPSRADVSAVGTAPKPGAAGTGGGTIYTFTSGDTVFGAADDEVVRDDWVAVLRAVASGQALNTDLVAITAQLRHAGHEIAETDLVVGEKIGDGASGCVHRGRYLRAEVAIKKLKSPPDFTNADEVLEFLKEVHMLSFLSHPNVVQMFGFCRLRTGEHLLVTEFVKGGDLGHALKNTALELPLRRQLAFALGIIGGLHFLHSRGIIHRDLKPENVLIDSWADAKVKIIDFGLSGYRGAPDDSTKFGTPRYAAPEIDQPGHTEQVDIFSFAIVLLEIVTREQVWPEVVMGSEFAQRYAAGERPPVPETHVCAPFIRQCWTPDPRIRPSSGSLYDFLDALLKRLPVDRVGYSDVCGQLEMAFRAAPRNTLSWLVFREALGAAIAVAAVDRAKLVFEVNGGVAADGWNLFRTWIAPLVMDAGAADATAVVELVFSICELPCFHGFLPAGGAQDALFHKQDGTYLFRFSTSNPGCLVVSITWQGVSAHWQIGTKLAAGARGNVVVFSFQGEDFTSLADLADFYTDVRDPADSRSGTPVQFSSPGGNVDYFLRQPYCRATSAYQTVGEF